MQSTHTSLPGTPHCRQQTWRKAQREATITDQRREKGLCKGNDSEKSIVCPGTGIQTCWRAGKRGEHRVRPGSAVEPLHLWGSGH